MQQVFFPRLPLFYLMLEVHNLYGKFIVLPEEDLVLPPFVEQLGFEAFVILPGLYIDLIGDSWTNLIGLATEVWAQRACRQLEWFEQVPAWRLNAVGTEPEVFSKAWCSV